MSFTTFPIYSTISKTGNKNNPNEFLVSYFWRTKEYNLYDNDGNTFFTTITAKDNTELNEWISKEFFSHFCRGDFEQCLSSLNYNDITCQLIVKHNNFIFSNSNVSYHEKRTIITPTKPKLIETLLDASFDPLAPIM